MAPFRSDRNSCSWSGDKPASKSIALGWACACCEGTSGIGHLINSDFVLSRRGVGISTALRAAFLLLLRRRIITAHTTAAARPDITKVPAIIKARSESCSPLAASEFKSRASSREPQAMRVAPPFSACTTIDRCATEFGPLNGKKKSVKKTLRFLEASLLKASGPCFPDRSPTSQVETALPKVEPLQS